MEWLDRLRYKRQQKIARSKGFSSYESYEIQTAVARKEGWEKAQRIKRQRELDRVKQEEYTNAMSTRPSWLRKLDKGIESFNRNVDKFSHAIASDKRKKPRVF